MVVSGKEGLRRNDSTSEQGIPSLEKNIKKRIGKLLFLINGTYHRPYYIVPSNVFSFSLITIKVLPQRMIVKEKIILASLQQTLAI